MSANSRSALALRLELLCVLRFQLPLFLQVRDNAGNDPALFQRRGDLFNGSTRVLGEDVIDLRPVPLNQEFEEFAAQGAGMLHGL